MNTMKKIAMPVVVLLGLAACEPMPGIVSDYNGASVKIRQDTTLSVAAVTDQITAEAERICRAGGKGRAEYASTMAHPNGYYAEHLFLCLS